jgi:hypothetical protein
MAYTKPGLTTVSQTGVGTPPSQTSFLGATVVDFDASIGWNGSGGSLKVRLVEDDQFCRLIDPNYLEGYAPPDGIGREEDLPKALYDPPVGTPMTYIPWGPETTIDGDNPAADDYGLRLIDRELKRRGLPTRKGEDLYTRGDMFWPSTMGSPVYFNFEGWKFNGILKSAERSMSSSGEIFNVTVDSPANILKGTQVILGDFMGMTAPFPALQGSVCDSAGYFNIINAFGYYENDKYDGNFGESGRNEAGMQWHDPYRHHPTAGPVSGGGGILTALEDLINNYKPYAVNKGDNGLGGPLYFNAHPNAQGCGRDAAGVPVGGSPCGYRYRVDLSQLSIYNLGVPRYFRISQNVMSLMAIIEEVCNIGSSDFFISLEAPTQQHYDDGFFGTIKVNIIKRHSVASTLDLQKTILTKEEDSSDDTLISSTLGSTLTDTNLGKMYIGGPSSRVVGADETNINTCGTIDTNPGDMDELRIGHPGICKSVTCGINIWPQFGFWKREAPALLQSTKEVINQTTGIKYYPHFVGGAAAGQPTLAGNQIPDAPSTDPLSNFNALDPSRDFGVNGPIHDIPVDMKDIQWPDTFIGRPFDSSGRQLQVDGIHLASITELRLVAAAESPAEWISYLSLFNVETVVNLELQSRQSANAFLDGDLSITGIFRGISQNPMDNINTAGRAVSSHEITGMMKEFLEEQKHIGEWFGKMKSVAEEYGTQFLTAIPFVPVSLDHYLKVECLDEPSAWGGTCSPSMNITESWKNVASAWVELDNHWVPKNGIHYDESGKLKCVVQFPAEGLTGALPTGSANDSQECPVGETSLEDGFRFGLPKIFTRGNIEKSDTVSATGPATNPQAIPTCETTQFIAGIPYVTVKCGRVKYENPLAGVISGPAMHALNMRGNITADTANPGSYADVGMRSAGGGLQGITTTIQAEAEKHNINGTGALMFAILGINMESRFATGVGAAMHHGAMAGSCLKPENILIPQLSTRFRWGPWAAGYSYGSAEVEVDDTLSPENFGGMARLDNVALSLAWYTSVFNMNHEESGELSLAAAPSSNLGETFPGGGPYITDISVKVGTGGVQTTYQFKTWEVKFGALAKYTEQRIATITNNLSKARSQIGSLNQKAAEEQLGLSAANPRILMSREIRQWFNKKSTGGNSPHPMIIGESYRELEGYDAISKDQVGDALYFDKYYSNVVTESVDESLFDLARGWSYKAGASMDAFFRPFSTNFNHQAYKASAPPRDGELYEPYPNFEVPTGPSPNLYDLNPFPGALDLIYEQDEENSSDIQLMVGKSATNLDGSIAGPYWDLPTEMNPRKRRRGCQEVYECGPDVEDHTSVIGSAGEAMEWYRTLGLRGPLVVVGWGYDTNDKPVPADPANSNAFLKNHRKRQDKWKAGPVDLRWDDERKVWAAGGGGGSSDIWLSQAVSPVGAVNGPLVGLGGNTYSNLACGGWIAYCTSCSHDAVAMFKAAEEPFYEDRNISQCPIRKNHAIEIILEEPRSYIARPDGSCDVINTDGGWLGQPIPAGTYLYTLNTGRVAVKNGESYPVHWILQAQFCQTNLITSVGCNTTTQGGINIATCTRDIWFEGTATEESCMQPSSQCP